ncbi:MAG: prepilin-type N-terminal cleavage/methylation domain-containing protein [Candidatus Gracilibacteria bacterium]|nr:prepilin-type N-terminal cleavage/methylation domain-containing protein [Candidatus Gracilibacteria bacterium]
MHKQKTNGFTLVELIVVITILAILGTIAFISLQGYSTSARDSTRISDLGAMKTSLELFQLDNGKYPIATNGIDITYSGSIVWNQGTFGETVYANTDKLDKIPLDPITDKQYTYSTTSKRNEFQLAGIIEGGDIAYYGPPLTPPYQGGELAQKVNAGTTEATAYITGNYNGQMTKSLSGVICNILAIPSIITNDTSITDLQQITSSQSFVYRGHKNLPGSFKGSKFKQDGGFEFSPNKLLAYTDTGSCKILSENTSTGITSRVDLLKGLQDAYTGTTLKNEGEIKNILALDIDTNNPSTTVKNYASTFVNNVFGSKILASGSNGNNTTNNIINDPYWSDVVLLMHFDGENGSTTFTDEKLHSFTNGGTIISGTEKKFGSGSAFFNYVNGLYLNSNDFKMGTGSFTIEFWFKKTSSNPHGSFMVGIYNPIGSSSAINLGDNPTGKQSFCHGAGCDIIGADDITMGIWHHFALTRSEGNIYLFLDGQLTGTVFKSIDYNNSTLMIGSSYPVDYYWDYYKFTGYIDELRITKGVARYTTGFTVPSEAFPNE